MLNVGVVGVSKYVRTAYWRWLAHQTDVKLAALCDISDEALSLVLDGEYSRNDPMVCSRIDQLVSNNDLDAVIVSTPHALHAAHVKICLEAGKHVLVDKPLARTITEAHDLVAAAEARGLVLAVANQRRFVNPRCSPS
jgi:predicted dehydrogenase